MAAPIPRMRPVRAIPLKKGTKVEVVIHEKQGQMRILGEEKRTLIDKFFDAREQKRKSRNLK